MRWGGGSGGGRLFICKLCIWMGRSRSGCIWRTGRGEGLRNELC